MASGSTVLKYESPLDLASKIMRAIGEQNKRNDFSDFTVVVEGVEFPSHRFILSAVSGYFRGLLTSGMVEDIQRRINLSGISLDTFAVIMECIFTGDNVLTDENVIDVWHASNLLDIPFLLSFCEDFIADHLNKYNCIDVYQNAQLMDNSKLMQLSWKMMLHTFDFIRFSEDILTLSLDDMKNLVTSVNLQTKSEDDVVDLIMRWISYTAPVRKCQSLEQVFCPVSDLIMPNMKNSKEQSQSERCSNRSTLTSESAIKCQICDCSTHVQAQQSGSEAGDAQTAIQKCLCKRDSGNNQEHSRQAHVVELLKCIRYCLISRWTVEQLRSNILFKEKDALSLINQCEHYQNEPSRRHDYLPTAAIYRNCSDLENVIIWTTEEVDALGRELTFLNYMNLVNNRVRLLFSERRGNCRLVVSGNHIFTVGNKQCFRFCSLRNTIDRLSGFAPRTGHTVVAVEDYIYVVGGCQNYVQRLSMNRNNMTKTVGFMSVAVSHTTAGVIRKNIIVLGGPQDRADMTVVQCFNTKTMTSHQVVNIKRSPQNLVVFHKDHCLFVLFGTGAVWKLEESATGIISIRYNMQLWDFDRKLNGAVLIGNELYLFEDMRPENIGAVSEKILPGVFIIIRNICQKGYGFHIAVMPKERPNSALISNSARSSY